MIHHGGSWLNAHRARRRNPALIVPTFSERESNARRAAALGAAICLIPEGAWLTDQQLDSQSVGDAIHRLLTDSQYRRAAQAVQRELEALPGAPGVADLVEAVDSR
jgi:UDP:flavonoid glycosyltransferase YjiC (YdhE family)